MEPDQKQFLTNVWPLVAVVLTASGILVKTVPLESKRPIDPDGVKLYHTDRGALRDDPFVVMRHVKGRLPMERCAEALADEDEAHHPRTLKESILDSSSRGWVTVLPVMVSGRLYFEGGEGRRRSRYAVVTALLNSGWRPSDEGQLEYVWTFESCVGRYWERRAPELLPYEWFAWPAQYREGPRALLVLWVDEEALTRGPLEGIERIIERLVQVSPPCPPSDDDSIYGDDKELRKKLTTVCKPKETQGWQMSGCPWNAKKIQDDLHLFGDPIQRLAPLRGCDVRVIGPSTSSTLIELARDLAQDLVQDLVQDLAWGLAQDLAQQRATPVSQVDLPAMPGVRSAGDLARQRATTDASWLRFYSSSGATAPVTDSDFQNISVTSWLNYYKNIDRRIANVDFQNELRDMLKHSFKSLGVTAPTGTDLQELRKSFKERVNDLATTDDKLPAEFINGKNLRESFEKRVVTLTTTDDKLSRAFMDELRRRLADATPFSRLPTRLNPKGEPLCGDTVVVISESDTRYARSFHEFFQRYFKSEPFLHCTEGGWPRVHPVYYLRGLDGMLPEGTGTPLLPASPPNEHAQTNTDVVFKQATLERAYGRSQYDYLRRLTAYLADFDRREKQAGRNGVRAIGVLGSDLYDKILILDALRDRFSKAVFFTPNLDARLLGREMIRSTRNLIVASSYGLTLNPGIQGAALPFRDTYQSGMYLSTLVALDPVLRQLSSADFSSWFKAPQLFEIGRTRAVPLSKGSAKACEPWDLEHCTNIHALDEWAGVSPRPNLTLVLTLCFVAATVSGLGWLLSRCVRSAASAIWNNAPLARRVATKIAVVLLPLLVLIGVGFWCDVHSDTREPFAWFEGVSIWPTKILELLILLVTVGLLFYGRWQLRHDIDTVAEEFGLTRLSERESATVLRVKGERGFWPWVRWLWWLDRTEVDSSGSGTTISPWLEFLDRMRWRPSFKRVFVMTALYFVFGMALISLDWPFSPHRGPVSAWFDHILLLALLLSMMALLLTVLDASEMTTHYFTRLGPCTLPQGEGPTDTAFWTRYPVGADAIWLWTRFRFAVGLASRVNRFIYLPFITLSLALPTRSRVFDAWDIPLPYIVLLGVSVTLAVRGAFSLRRAAAELKTQTLVQLEHLELTAKLAQYGRSPETDTTPAPGAAPEPRGVSTGGTTAAARVDILPADPGNESTPAPDDIPPQIKADLLRRIADEIRSVQEGPFRPWTQEPVVRALLIVSGWAGGISTIEFLFLN